MLARRFKIPLLKAALKSTAGWKTAKKPTSTTYQQHPKYSGGTDRTSATTANTKNKKFNQNPTKFFSRKYLSYHHNNKQQPSYNP